MPSTYDFHFGARPEVAFELHERREGNLLLKPNGTRKTIEESKHNERNG
jgi:hypothetical protein